MSEDGQSASVTFLSQARNENVFVWSEVEKIQEIDADCVLS